MHAQIQQVISTMHAAPLGRIHINFSAAPDTALAKVLNDMFYKTRASALLDLTQSIGYRHNGDEQTLRLTMKPQDAVAFIEAIKEDLKGKRPTDEEYCQVVFELSYISQELYVYKNLK